MAESVGFFFHVLFLVLLMIVILCGNSLVIIAFKTNKRLRTATYTFLVSLAVSDFLVGSVSLPLWVYHLRYYPNSVEVGLTNFYACIDIFSALASIFHLTGVTLERWIAICKPFYYNTLSKRSYHISILIAWFLALAVAAPYPKIYTPKEKLVTAFKVYTVIIFLLGLVIPSVLITFVNLSIFKVVKSVVKNTRQQLDHSSDRALDRNIFRDRKTAITLVLITTLFCVSWTPFFLINLVPIYCGHCFSPMLDNVTFVSCVKWLHYSNSAYNPVVYAFRDAEMRLTFVRLFKRCGRVLKSRQKPKAEWELSLNTDFVSSPCAVSNRRGDTVFSSLSPPALKTNASTV